MFKSEGFFRLNLLIYTSTDDLEADYDENGPPI